MPDARALLAIADALAPRFRKAFLEAVAELNDQLSTADIIEALGRGDIKALERAGGWQVFGAKLEPALREAVLTAVTRAGDTAAGRLPASVRAQLTFDRTNPKALEAVDTVVRDAVADITNASKDAVELVIRQGFREGWTPQVMAKRLRDAIGLTERFAQAVENYRAGQLAQDVPQGRADELAAQYADRLLRLRATTIARTESIRAMNAGQQGAWLDAASQGLLDRSGTKRFWVVTPDDRLCPLCEAVPDMNPDGVGLDEPFQTESGAVMFPPLHVLCRCVATLHFLAKVAA